MGSTPCYGFHMRLNRKPNLFLRFPFSRIIVFLFVASIFRFQTIRDISKNCRFWCIRPITGNFMEKKSIGSKKNDIRLTASKEDTKRSHIYC